MNDIIINIDPIEPLSDEEVDFAEDDEMSDIVDRDIIKELSGEKSVAMRYAELKERLSA